MSESSKQYFFYKCLSRNLLDKEEVDESSIYNKYQILSCNQNYSKSILIFSNMFDKTYWTCLPQANWFKIKLNHQPRSGVNCQHITAPGINVVFVHQTQRRH